MRLFPSMSQTVDPSRDCSLELSSHDRADQRPHEVDWSANFRAQATSTLDGVARSSWPRTYCCQCGQRRRRYRYLCLGGFPVWVPNTFRDVARHNCADHRSGNVSASWRPYRRRSDVAHSRTVPTARVGIRHCLFAHCEPWSCRLGVRRYRCSIRIVRRLALHLDSDCGSCDLGCGCVRELPICREGLSASRSRVHYLPHCGNSRKARLGRGR
ncbi:unannotated protein [freshwater metagenome]|uniref:Unannotated protein n=1 Tax=freshwater metagenome TaxID=449393 RepID=A0A6J6N552_9ZZZZ